MSKMRMFTKINMKKLLLSCVALMAAMALLLCGCGKSEDKDDKKGSGNAKDPVEEVVTSTGLVEQATAMYGDIVTLYKNVLSGDSKLYTSTDVRLVLGDDVKDLLADLLDAQGVDYADDLLDIADGMTVGVDAGWQGNLMQMAMRLGRTDDKGVLTDVIHVDCIADAGEGNAYIGIPSLLDGYLTTSFEPVDLEGAMGDLSEQMAELEAVLAQYEAVLPSEELFGKVLSKYVEIIVETLDGDESTETVEANGVKEKLTVTEITLDQKTVYEVALAVLNAAKEDKDIQGWMEDTADYLEIQSDLHGEFVKALDEVIAELSEEDDFDTENYFELALYTNKDGVLVGMDMAMIEDDEKVVDGHCLMTVSGDTFGYEVSVNDLFAIEGKGTEDKGVIDATFDVVVEDQDVLQIKVIDYDGANGSFRFVPDADLLAGLWDTADLPADVAAFVSLLDLGLQIDVKSDDDGGEMGLYLMDDDEVLIGFATAVAITEKEIEVPASSDVYTEDEMAELLATLDYEQLLKSLRKIGVPADLCDELESALELMESYGGSMFPELGDSSYEDSLGGWEL